MWSYTNGVWSVVGDPYCGDRQDFVHKLEFEVSKGKIGRSYINLMTFSPRQAVWVTDYRTWHRCLISHREDDQGRTCAMSYCLLCWDSKYDCTALQCACKCPSGNTDQITVEYCWDCAKTLQILKPCKRITAVEAELHNSEGNCFIRKHLQFSLSINMRSK